MTLPSERPQVIVTEVGSNGQCSLEGGAADALRAGARLQVPGQDPDCQRVRGEQVVQGLTL